MKIIFTLISIAYLSNLAQAMPAQESHLRNVLGSWAEVDPQSIRPEMDLRSLWLENHQERLFNHFDTTGSLSLAHALQADSLFGSCPSSAEAGEFGCAFHVCGDLQTVRELYLRLLNCSESK